MRIVMLGSGRRGIEGEGVDEKIERSIRITLSRRVAPGGEIGVDR